MEVFTTPKYMEAHISQTTSNENLFFKFNALMCVYVCM